MAAEKRKVQKWGWKTLLALLGLAAAGAFGFFSIFNTVRVTAAEPALSENEANEAASVTITDAELEQLLSGELTLDSLTRTGTDEAPAASEAQGTAAGEQPARTESEAAAPSEPEDSASGTEQSAASSSEAPAEKKQQEAACEAEVKALIQQTYALKAIAEKGLNSSISAAKAEYKTLPAEQQTKTKKIMICLSKTGELTSLQSYCDKEMGRIVSQLRTVLKENGQSTELADQVMSTYKAETFKRFGIPYEAKVLSAHRTPDAALDYAAGAQARGMKVLIGAAGGAAHLAGVLAAKTGRDGGRALLLALLEVRAGFMLGIVRKDPSQWANAHGWSNRLLRLQNYLLSTRFGEGAA